MSGVTELHFPVITSPFASLLAGHGAARWLADLGEQIAGEHIDVRIVSSGAGAIISADAAISPRQVTADHYRSPLSPWILTAKNGPPPGGSAIIDYEAERRHNSDYADTTVTIMRRSSACRRRGAESASCRTSSGKS